MRARGARRIGWVTALVLLAGLVSSAQFADAGRNSPPPVTIHFGDKSAKLKPWTYCYGRVCADGFPPEHPVNVGSVNRVRVEFPLKGWRFTATFTPAGVDCGRRQQARLEKNERGRSIVEPLGYAGTYDVTLFGRGDGDLFVTFRWKTPFDGPLPKPRSYVGVLADHDGKVDSYGVELSVSNMADTPERVRATITVTSAEGKSLTFDATKREGRCMPEGSLFWRGPDKKGQQAAKLGSKPFRYEVVLRLDGKRHRARATWPEDEIRWLAPYVWLHFKPKLPALR